MQASTPVSPGSGIMNSLERATRLEHAAIESVVPLTQPGLTWAAYRDYLARLYGFYEPIEERLGATLTDSAFADEFERRRKLPLLERDLFARGDTAETIARLPRCIGAALPTIIDATTAFGALYVLEGSTLGGRVLTRHLEATLGLVPRRDAALLSSDGGDIGAAWRTFGVAIERHANTLGASDIERLLEAARATFVSLRRWIVAGAQS